MEINEVDIMLKKISNNNYDLIFASRYEKGAKSDDDTFVTLIGNKIFTLIGKIFFSLGITDILYTFVLGKTKKCNELNLKSENFNFCVELPIKAKRNSYNLGTIESFERKRIAGQKKVNEFSDGLKILNHLIYFYFKKK